MDLTLAGLYGVIVLVMIVFYIFMKNSDDGPTGTT